MVEQLFGVDYYPEHWSEDRWPVDAALMQQAGINTVRLAEFAWSKLEPQAGVFDFSWLDRAITVLSQHGIRVILGTPTAAPPAWLIQAHPEILPVNEDGQRASFGMRRHYCPSQPAFHEATQHIVTAMAMHYSEHASIFAWQIDNEISSIINGIRCHCDTCRASFQQWLRQRYGSLESLNESWGTVFWSQSYSDWEQIPVPLRNTQPGQGSAHNPSLYLDFARFSSENWVRYQDLHLTILRKICPHHTLTHNLMGLFPFINYVDLARNLDVVAWDNYPRLPAIWSPFKGMWDASHTALSHDLMRSLKKQPFWVMEQQAGASGWGRVSPSPLPGELRLWTWQSIAHGAAGIVYFRWRTCLVGTEQYWHGILPHDGIPGWRYQEISQTRQEMLRIGDLALSALPAQVGIIRSYQVLWAFETQPTAEGLSYDDQILRHYRALWRRNIATDVLTEEQDWSAYNLLIVPCLFVHSREFAARLHQWVQAGGILLLTFRSGVKDEHSKIIDSSLPGELRELAGVRVTDYTALLPQEIGEPAGGPDRLEMAAGNGQTQRVSAEIWMDDLELQGAEVLGRYHGGMYNGSPAVTVHKVGKGCVFYVGTALNNAGLDLLMEHVLERVDIAQGIVTPANVEIVHRVQDEIDYWFVLNHNPEPQTVKLPTDGVDLLSGRTVIGTIVIKGYDVLVIRC
jgi:beta-galactosidase